MHDTLINVHVGGVAIDAAVSAQTSDPEPDTLPVAQASAGVGVEMPANLVTIMGSEQGLSPKGHLWRSPDGKKRKYYNAGTGENVAPELKIENPDDHNEFGTIVVRNGEMQFLDRNGNKSGAFPI